MSGTEDAREGSDPWWWSTAWSAIETEAATLREFDAYTLTEVYGIGAPDHPNRWGSLFSHAHRVGLIEHAGFAVSRRRSRAGGLTRTWRGCKQFEDSTEAA